MIDDLEKIMIRNYTHVFKDILLSEFKSDPALTGDYLSQTTNRQHDIEKEINLKSSKMAESLVAKLKKKGYLENEPSENELTSIIEQTLEEYGK